MSNPPYQPYTPPQLQPQRPPRPPTKPLYDWKDHAPPDARLVYIRDAYHADNELKNLKTGPVGFDLEWKPNFVKGHPENQVALMQIATQETVLLIQLSTMRTVPPELRGFLLRRDIIKAGVGIQGDVLKLFRDWKLSVCSCVDLSLMARSVDNDHWKGRYVDPLGLSRLLEHYKGFGLMKGKITRSNWEAYLKPPQQKYAASDAYAGLQLYEHLRILGTAMAEPPDTTCYTFDAISGAFCDPATGALWYPQNPSYDPGPPPAPKSPKPPKAEGPRRQFSTPSDIMARSPTAGPSQSPLSRSSFARSPVQIRSPTQPLLYATPTSLGSINQVYAHHINHIDNYLGAPKQEHRSA